MKAQEIKAIFCKCGKAIEKPRLEATKGRATTCISCMHSHDVGRVAGLPLHTGKTTYSDLQLMDQETAQRLYHMQERKGQSPGNGIRMKGH